MTKLCGFIFFLTLIHSSLGQVPAASSLALSSNTANPGDIVSMSLSLTTAAANNPAALQWTISYPADDVVLGDVTAGSSLASVVKSIYCNRRTGTVTCLAAGMNSYPIPVGEFATVTFSVASATGSSSLPISIGGTIGVLGDGTAVPVNGISGSVTINHWQPLVPAYFTDVASTDLSYTAANLLYANGISKGCSNNPLDYCPDRSLTRAEMATLIVRAIGADVTSSNPNPYFTDVPAGNPYFPWIQELYELGITGGCSDNPLMFCPDRTITRQEMAVFTTRGRYGATAPFAFSPLPYFSDVPAGNLYFNWIQKVADLGMSGCDPVSYCPGDPVTRGDTALFVVRGLLNQLLPIGTPVISMVSPATVIRGGSAVTLLISGTNTHFAAGTTLNAGPGITVSGLAAVDAQTLMANLTVSASATPGPRSLIATTGQEEAVLPNGLKVQ